MALDWNDKAKKVMQRQESLEKIKEPRDSTFTDIINFVLPGLEDMQSNKGQRGNKQGEKRYDGTGVSALQLFADGHYGYIVSPSITWIQFVMQNKELGENPAVRTWLQKLEQHYYGVFNQSNFYESISTYFEYAGAFGFASIYSEEDVGTGMIVFRVDHPKEIYCAENKYGQVDLVHRKCMIDKRTAIDKFGKGAFDEPFLRLAEKNGFEEDEYIHAVYPRKDRDQSKSDNRNMPFESIWILTEGEQKKNGKIIRESGYKMNPYHVWRYKKGMTPYGQGPAEDALVEIMGLNEIAKDLLRAAQLAADPPFNVPSSLEGVVDIRPRGLNFMQNTKNEQITAIQTGANNFPIGIDREQKMIAAIERHFKVEFFILLASQEGGAKTATEVMELMGEKAAVLGRPITRLNTECLNPIIDRIFQIELEGGRLPVAPPEIEDAEIDVNFVGPLAQAQKRLFETQGIRFGLEAVIPFFELWPETKDIPKPDESIRKVLRASGWPQEAINDKLEVQKIRDIRAEAIQQENMQQDMMQMAEMGEKVAKADKLTGNKMSEAAMEGEGAVQ